MVYKSRHSIYSCMTISFAKDSQVKSTVLVKHKKFSIISRHTQISQFNCSHSWFSDIVILMFLRRILLITSCVDFSKDFETSRRRERMAVNNSAKLFENYLRAVSEFVRCRHLVGSFLSYRKAGIAVYFPRINSNIIKLLFLH